MVDRVAVLSDVHGVLPALEAVLTEPDVRTADRIVLTGDLAAGPLPVQTLDLLASLGERAVWVRGNGDRALVEGHPDPGATWAASQLRPDQKDRLAALPLTVTLDVAGWGRRSSATRRRVTTRSTCSWTPRWQAGGRYCPQWTKAS